MLLCMDTYNRASARSLVAVESQQKRVANGSLQSLDWSGEMEIVECVLQGERSLLMQFSMKVTVGVLFLIEFVR